MDQFEDMPVLEKEEMPLHWGGGQNEENIPPKKGQNDENIPPKKKQFDFKLNRNLNPEEFKGNGYRCISAGQASSGRFKGGEISGL
jgi:hypothetical protein